MPETIASYVAAAAFNAGYVSTAIVMYNYGAAIITATAFAASVYAQQSAARRQQQSARDSYNASLRDRYVMTRSAIEPRQVVLGRERVSGPLAYIGSYGTNRQNLVFALILAGHEIDAVEAVYFDDERVTIDGSGNVTAVNRRDLFSMTGETGTFTLSSEPDASSVVASVAYGSTTASLSATVTGSSVAISGGTAGQTGTVTISYRPARSPYLSDTSTDQSTTITLNSSGNGATTLPFAPVAGSVVVVYASDPSADSVNLTEFATVSGSTVTVTGAPVTSVTATVGYRTTVPQGDASPTRARVRAYLGAPGQSADSGMVSALPGVWTTSHTMSGLAYLVVELDYDPDAFPSGLPNVSAVIRGAKLYDPRTGNTTWSANPALMMRYVATSSLLGRQPESSINDASIAAAANVCDASTSYLVNGQTFVRPLYTAGLVVKSGARPKDALDDLARAMAGRWVVIDGQLRVRAGSYRIPLQELDETWLTGPGVQVETRSSRQDVINVITGKFSDDGRDFVVTDFPRVQSSAYITEDGAELPLDMDLKAVTFVGQAQQVAAAMLRDARQGLRVTLQCNMRAYPVEVFDTLLVTLSRFGWQAKPFEVLDISWTIEGGIQLTLKETDPSIWALGTSFAASDLAPNTLFPSPWSVPSIAGLACDSGTNQLSVQDDGTVVSRVRVTWTALTDALVLRGGGVEVRYGRAVTPESQWQSVMANQAQSEVMLTGLRDGDLYLVKARAFNGLVRGAWSLPILHKVIGKTALPATLTGATAAQQPGGVLVAWSPNTEADFAETEWRTGASWAAGTRVFKGRAASFVWPWPAAGTYTLRGRHRDTTGNESSTDATLSVTVGSGVLIGTSELAPSSATEVVLDEYDFGGTTYGTATARTISYTPPVSCTIELTAGITATNLVGDSGNQLGWVVTPSGGSSTTVASAEGYSTAKTRYTGVGSFAATGGVALSIEIKTTRPTGNPSIGLFLSTVRLTVIKR